MRRIGFSLALLVLLAAACAPQSSTPIVPTVAFSTKTPPKATPTSTLAPTLVTLATSEPATCTVQSGLNSTPNPTAAALYAPVTDADWVEGPATAKVTILDYSDFQ